MLEVWKIQKDENRKSLEKNKRRCIIKAMKKINEKLQILANFHQPDLKKQLNELEKND